jgi:putative iron-only hydrogenase system regulator
MKGTTISEKRIGTVSIIITKRENQASLVNGILSEYGNIIIGRMGIPYSPKDIHIITLIIHGTTDEIGALTGKLGLLSGVQVKSAMTKA